MACCTGQTKCNDTVTIGYLKSFIGSDILTTAGTPVSVSTSQPDSYCPTYAELTGGTIIPNFVDGGTNKWASNVDGITINHGSSYSGNQVVKVNDLILTYTRYKSIAVSASSTSLSECGGSTTLGRTFKLTKTIKAMNDCNGGVPSTSSSEGSDSAFTTTYSSTQGWLTINGNTATAPKNGTVSSSTLTTEVKASVNYKGATHTSTGVTVSQAALTGAYETTGTTTPTGMNLIITPSDQKFGCRGGNYTITGTGNYYTRYKWKDSCGVVYNNVYNDVQGTDNVGPYGGTLDVVNCSDRPCDPCYTYDVNVQWSGITSTVTFTQSCQERCEECNSYDEWGSGNGTATAPCEGGSVKVTAEVSGMHYERVYIGDVCRTVSSAETSMVQDINVNIPQNDTDSGKTYTGSGTTSQGGTINYTITQPGGCAECTGAITTTEWSGQTVSAAACDTSKNLTLSGTSTTTYDNCSPKIESVISAVTVNFNENSTSNPTSYTFTFSNATVTVNQAAGPCTEPVVCYCSGVTLSTSSVNWTYSSTTQQSVTVTKDACIGTVNVASNNAHFTASISGTNIRIQPTSTNSGTTDIEGVVTVSYTADTTPCTKTINLTQGNSGSCNCASVVFTEKTTTIGSGATPSSGVVIASVSFGDCSGSLGSASVDADASSWLSARTSGNDVLIDADENTDLSNDRRGVVTVSYKANSDDVGYNCSSSFTVNQSSTPCTCDAVSTFITSMQRVFGSGGTHGDTVLFASGDTHGCGTLTATTQADESGMLVGGSLIVEDIDGSGYEKVRFYVKVNGNYTGIGRSAGAVITYTPKDPSIDTCSDYIFMLEQFGQKKPLAGCNDIEVSTNEVTLDCYGKEYSTYGTTLATLELKSGHDDVDLGSSTYGDGLRFANGRTDGNWFYADVSGRRISIKRADANYDQVTPAEPRTGIVHYTVVRVESGKTVDCMSSSTTFVQQGCSIARDCSGCTYAINSASLNDELNGVPKEGATFNLWDYIYGPSFCEPSTFANISVENLPSWISFDGSTGMLTVASGETQERSSNITVKISSGSSLNACDSVTATVRQLGTCDCNAYTITVNGNNTDYTSKTIIVTYTGNIYNCGPLLGVSESTLPDWITASMGTGSNTGGSITLNVSQNTGTTIRSATVVVGIRKNPPGYGDELLCIREVVISQEPNCGCGIYNNRPSHTTTIYGSGQVAEYRLTNSGSCLSYSVTSDNPSFAASYSTANNAAGDYVYVDVQDNTTGTGCTTGDITFNIYTDGTLCYTDSFTVTSIIGCDPYPSGELYNDGETAFTYDTNTHTIGTIYRTQIGWADYQCYSLSSHTDYNQYFEDISITHYAASDYKINVTLKSGITGDWPIAPTIDFYIMKSDACGGGGISEAVWLGGIQLQINQP